MNTPLEELVALISKGLFGTEQFLPVAFAVSDRRSDGQPFSPRDLNARATSVPNMLRRLEKLELIEPYDQPGARKQYTVFDGPLWRVIEVTQGALKDISLDRGWEPPEQPGFGPANWKDLEEYYHFWGRYTTGSLLRLAYLIWISHLPEAEFWPTDLMRLVPRMHNPMSQLEALARLEMASGFNVDQQWVRLPNPLWEIGVTLGEVLPELLEERRAISSPRRFKLPPLPEIKDIPIDLEQKMAGRGGLVPVLGDDPLVHIAPIEKRDIENWKVQKGVFVRGGPTKSNVVAASSQTLCRKHTSERLSAEIEPDCEKCLAVARSTYNYRSATEVIEVRRAYKAAMVEAYNNVEVVYTYREVMKLSSLDLLVGHWAIVTDGNLIVALRRVDPTYYDLVAAPPLFWFFSNSWGRIGWSLSDAFDPGWRKRIGQSRESAR